ncbi:MAG: DUF3667 domain-containing protein [Salinibacter sp.]|uniref:DUF3667 domain-containing protein n=1 Tax=Salinibacter sp. TaxID=2065818 RepID=UPI0035D4888C
MPDRSTDPEPQPDSAPAPTGRACQNCGAPLVGTYCHECGQRHLSTLRVRDLARLFVEAIFELEDLQRGAWRTVVQAARNPGRVARRYAGGERKRFINPIGYFLMAATGAFLVFLLFRDSWVQGQVEILTTTWRSMGVEPSELFEPGAPYRVMFGVTSVQELAQVLFEWVQQLQTYSGFVIGAAAALFLRAFFPDYSLGEALVFELYVTAQATVLTALLAPLFFTAAPGLVGAVGPLLQVGLHAHGGRAFFGGRWRGWLLPALAYLAGMIVFILLSALIGLIGTTLVV